jgi:hypothetical protein
VQWHNHVAAHKASVLIDVVVSLSLAVLGRACCKSTWRMTTRPRPGTVACSVPCASKTPRTGIRTRCGVSRIVCRGGGGVGRMRACRVSMHAGKECSAPKHHRVCPMHQTVICNCCLPCPLYSLSHTHTHAHTRTRTHTHRPLSGPTPPLRSSSGAVWWGAAPSSPRTLRSW